MSDNAMPVKYVIEDFQKVNATKDYVFKELVCDREVIEELTRVVLNDPDVEIIACEEEASYCAGLDMHRIYCDVVGKKSDLGLVDLEMQVRIKGDLVERAQYYASLVFVSGDKKETEKIDGKKEAEEPKEESQIVELLKERSSDYRKIPNSYSIWFTVGDACKNGKPVNVIEYGLVTHTKEITSKATIIFYNICLWEEMEGEMRDICHFLLQSTKEVYSQSNSYVVKLMYDRLEELKKSQVKEKDYMKHEREIVEAVQDAVEDAIEEMNMKHEREKAEAVQDAVEDTIEEMNMKHEREKAEAIQESKIQMIMEMAADNMPVPKIARFVKLSTDEVQRYIEEHSFA